MYRQLLLILFLSLLLLAQMQGDWSSLAHPAYAVSSGTRPNAPATMTYQQFLKEKRADNAYHGPLVFPQQTSVLPGQARHSTNYAQLLPSAEPVTMKPLVQPLATSFLQGSAGIKPLASIGSDGRLEVQIQPGAFDLSRATVVSGGSPVGSLTLRLTQIFGHFTGFLNILGSYQIQLVDSQGNIIDGIRLRTPITFIYHYQPSELFALGLDPDHLLLTWPSLIAAALKAHASTANDSILLRNDPKADTLTGQSLVFDGLHPYSLGGGDPSNQSPPALHLASVEGNSGQLAYNYPLNLPPGAGSFSPQLSLKYSSSDPNERHSLTSSANNVGDGWSLSLGSISTEVYPNGTSWYFLSGVANAGDRLIPASTANFFDTEHLSYLQIQIINPTSSTPCFHVWDKSGTYYELGCTTNSLQYWTDSGGTRHNYRWDVNKIIAPNEGSTAAAYRMILVSYLQDSVTTSGHTTIRDAAIQQITYGSGNANTITALAGTVDFHYRAPTAHGTWADAYGSNYNCTGTPPDGTSTTLRCDDPIQKSGSGTFNAPTVFSTLSLQSVTSYVGSDGSASNKDYSYSFTYSDTPYQNCNDPLSLAPGYCAGEHVLMSITPTVYQNGTANQLKGVLFGYTDPTDPNTHDTYYDGTHTVGSPAQAYQVTTSWKYLNSYRDTNTGVGGQISYYVAYNNAHGTPTKKDGNGFIIDNRYDPFYCPNHANDTGYQCTGNWAHPDDHAWSEQVVTQIKSWSLDSSSSQLQQATTLYSYRLAKTGTWDGKTTWCEPDQYNQNQDCVGDNWIAPGDSDWQDYYHAEYHGFAQVYITSPANDLTVDTYYSTEGWNTPRSDGANYLGGSLQEEDIYSGNSASSTALLQKTVDTYVADSSACHTPTATYPACEVILLNTKATQYELTGSGNTNAPWVQHSYTYDDYTGSALQAGYHNLVQEVITASNAPTVTKKWTYTTDNQTVNNWTYYTVDKVTHSEIDDASSHVWQCQDITYDEGVGTGIPTPAAGWSTTVKKYSDCTKTSTAITTFTGYDIYGNIVATVDGLATSNSTLYNNNGCTLSTAPAIMSSAWGKTHYSTCAVYDATYHAQAVTTTNVFNQSTSIGYDNTQGEIPTSTADVNNQNTTYTYTYDTNGNSTVQKTEPLHAGSYTAQSHTNSSCTQTSTLPCYEIDTNSYLYSSATKQTFYDGLERQVETRTPGPGAAYDTVLITVYNDQTHSQWQSVPFQVAHGRGWIDPNGANDYNGQAPGGTVTFYDALGRAVATQDPNFGSSQEPGIACSATLSGNFTSCTNYSLGTVSGDTATYASVTEVDPNKHVAISYEDILGRTVYLLADSGLYGGTLTPAQKTATQYNVLNKMTLVTVTDLIPQSGQSITSAATTTSYDDLGRVTTLNDPDRGTHTYTYDANDNTLTDVSGTRTLGYNNDLQGRVGCIQDAAPTINTTGACSAGNPLVQNTYDTTKLGSQGNTDFPVGYLTQTVATTYYPEGVSGTVTQQFQHDQRGRIVTQQESISLPSSWNVTTALPTYQLVVAYNDADQVTTTTTSTIPSGQGFTTTVAYDSTGTVSGLSNNTSSTPNLATLTYNARAQLDTIQLLTSTGGALANDQFGYNANLRETSTTATWQGGSGQSGTIMSQVRMLDNADNVIGLTTTLLPASGQNNSGGTETQNFCYNEQNQLVWAGNGGTQPGAGNGVCGSGTLGNSLNGAGYTNSFVYTRLGQLWQAPLNGGSTQYQYLYCNSNHPHELTGLYPIGTTCSNLSGAVYTSSYDTWGNETSRMFSGTTATLSYDKFDRLVEWNAGSTNQEWTLYDASGNRVLSRMTNGSGTSLIAFIFGMEEHNYSSTGTNQWNTYYYTLAGHLIGALDGNGTRFYLTDALGSILADITNSAGGAQVKGNQVFGPYGKGRYYSGDINTGKGFTGQYNDGLTGLDYYNARWYDPKVGIFLSADTVQGNVQGVDPYTYVSGNPETLTDPTGHCDWWNLVCDWQTSGVGQAVDSFVVAVGSTVGGGLIDLGEAVGNFIVDWGPLAIVGAAIAALAQPPTPLSCGCVSPSDSTTSAVTAAAAASVAVAKARVEGKARDLGRYRAGAWDRADQLDLVDSLNKFAAATRQADKSSDAGKKNAAAGILTIWDKSGNIIFNQADAELAVGWPYAEQFIVDWAERMIKGLAGRVDLAGATINLLILSQTPVCGSCLNSATKQIWWNQLYQATGPAAGVTVNIDVWEGGGNSNASFQQVYPKP